MERKINFQSSLAEWIKKEVNYDHNEVYKRCSHEFCRNSSVIPWKWAQRSWTKHQNIVKTFALVPHYEIIVTKINRVLPSSSKFSFHPALNDWANSIFRLLSELSAKLFRLLRCDEIYCANYILLHKLRPAPLDLLILGQKLDENWCEIFFLSKVRKIFLRKKRAERRNQMCGWLVSKKNCVLIKRRAK